MSKVTADGFATMVDACWVPNVNLYHLLFQAAAENYQAHFPDSADCLIAGIRALMSLSKHSTIAFNRLLDAYGKQVELRCGEDNEKELETMKESLSAYYSAKPAVAFAQQILPSLDNEQQALLEGTILPGPEETKLKDRMAKLGF